MKDFFKSKKTKLVAIIALIVIFLAAVTVGGISIGNAIIGTDVEVSDVSEWKLVFVGDEALPLSKLVADDFKLVAVMKDGTEKTIKNSRYRFENNIDCVKVYYKDVIVKYTGELPENIIDVGLSEDDVEIDIDYGDGTNNGNGDSGGNKNNNDSGVMADGNNSNNDGGNSSDDGYFTEDDAQAMNESITHMEIVQMPDKTEYMHGEYFNARGLIIDVYISNGTVKRLNNINVPDTKMTPSKKVVRVSYTHSSSLGYVDVPVTVQARMVESFKILSMPKKTNYIEDEKFDPTGLKVEIVFDNGDRLNKGYTYSTSLLKAGQEYVTIQYLEYDNTLTEDVPITVEKKQFLSMVVEKKPDKTEYIDGEQFNKKGMVVQAKYNNGLIYPLTSYKIKNSTVTIETKAVVIEHEESGVKDEASIPVRAVKKAASRLFVEGTHKKLLQGKTFNAEGLTVKVEYNSGVIEVVPNFTFPKTQLKLEDKEIIISAIVDEKEISCKFPIKVSNTTPVSIEIKQPPVKTNYIEAELFDATGMIVEATYDNGTKAIINPNYSKADIIYGQTEIEISYTENFREVKAIQNITVKKRTPTKIVIEKAPNKVRYIEEEVFDPTGMEVRAYFDNGKDDIIVSEYEKTEFTFGMTEREITYTENGVTKTAIQKITVRKRLPISISVTTPPDKLSYIEEQCFDATGMIVTATYDNGKSYDVTGYTYFTGKLTAGQTPLEISYIENDGAKTCNLDINVRKKLPTSIIVTKKPNKLNYIEEEVFDPSGMEVMATYDNGTTAMVTAESPTSEVVLNQTYVTISYSLNGGTVTTTVDISIRKRQPVSFVINTEQAKKQYVHLENFNPSGMILEITFDNGKKALKNENDWVVKKIGATYDKEYVLDIGGQIARNSTTHSLSLCPTDNQSNIMTTVAMNITTVDAKRLNYTLTKPTKTEYIEGETMVHTGGYFTVYYDNGLNFRANVTRVIDNTPFILGETKRALSAKDYMYPDKIEDMQADCAITVIPAVPNSIKITKQPNQIAYDAGRLFKSAGMVVKGIYSDGSEREITAYSYPNVLLTQGQNYVTLSYTYRGTTRTVNCSVTVGPQKTVYYRYPTKTENLVAEVPTGDSTTKWYSVTHMDRDNNHWYVLYTPGWNSGKSFYAYNPVRASEIVSARIDGWYCSLSPKFIYPTEDLTVGNARWASFYQRAANNSNPIQPPLESGYVAEQSYAVWTGETRPDTFGPLSGYKMPKIMKATPVPVTVADTSIPPTVLTVSKGTYPDNDVSGSYWYVKQYDVVDTIPLPTNYFLRSASARAEIEPVDPPAFKQGERIPYEETICVGVDKNGKPIYETVTKYTAPYGSISIDEVNAEIAKMKAEIEARRAKEKEMLTYEKWSAVNFKCEFCKGNGQIMTQEETLKKCDACDGVGSDIRKIDYIGEVKISKKDPLLPKDGINPLDGYWYVFKEKPIE